MRSFENQTERIKSTKIHHDSLKKERLIKSGAGIIAALAVLLVFILAATWLLSLPLGLVLAYVFLPMEKWYERHLSKGGRLHFISRALGNISSSIGKLTPKVESSLEELERKARKQLISRAATATLITVIILALAIAGLAVASSYKYISRGIRSAYNASTVQPDQYHEDLVQIPENFPFAKDIQGWINKLEEQKTRFESLPVIRDAIGLATLALTDERIQQEILAAILKRTGGVVSMTAGIIYGIVIFMLNTLLTLFFFSLLLRKMAENVSTRKGDTAEQQSRYIVKAFIHNDWMPGAGENSLKEAQGIISEVINRLKLCLRGYLTLVLIDSVLYSIVFAILGVPYWLILGVISGLAVLLPYIGPVVSGGLTILVCLVFGAGQPVMLKIVLVLAFYLFYNGIIEQFILYPRIIGDRLGLTTLETIIVVLLGALFAGIPGMILALPTASVLKYLLGQIYALWRPPHPPS